MNIAYISTVSPMQCGIATFNQNLFQAIESTNVKNNSSFMVAISDANKLKTYNFPSNVKYVVRKNNQNDYLLAADYINSKNLDICIIQHEFGIFGGEEGLYVLNLIAKINKPIVSILHTVLENPTYNQLIAIQQIAKRSKKIVVMSHKAVNMLKTIYQIDESRIDYIGHGVPNLEPLKNNPITKSYPFKNKKVLLTFGLISRGKGLETVIEALPEIVKNHPDVVYVILGKTHPEIIKNSGEEYRDSLNKLAKKLDVDRHLVFIDEFVQEDELFNYLCACHIYITPYPNVTQITSGTLSYAVGAGCAVISTPYWHAEELLADERGLLFPFRRSDILAEKVNYCLDNPSAHAVLKNNAFQYGLNLRWNNIGKLYLQLFKPLILKNAEHLKPSTIIQTEDIPKFNTTHLKRLTDDTGIVQHAKYGIPNLKEGYCLDDNSRALIMALMAYQQYKNKDVLELIPIYLSYIQYMQNEDGSFRNFLSFDRKYLDEIGSEDSYGRTLWALGYMINTAPIKSYQEFANELFLNSLNHLDKLEYIRGRANSLIGLCQYLKIKPITEELKKHFDNLLNPIIEDYKNNKTDSWPWFEKQMTYDNAILPLSLWCSYEVTHNEEHLQIAKETTAFLIEVTLFNGYYNPVGNDGWFSKNSEFAQYDQQAIETMAMVIALYKAYEVTQDEEYLHHLNTSFHWFLGENSLNIPLYDHETKGCADGLQPNGVNRNQGAESTLAYFISHFIIFKALELEFKFSNLDNSR